MAETVRELITKWGFQVDDQPLEKMKESLNGVKDAVAMVGTQLLAAGGYLFGLTKSFADAGDAVSDTAYKLGVSTQALQELGYAAQLAGSSQDELNLSLLKFGKAIGSASEGSGAAYDSLNMLSNLIGKDIAKSTGSTEDKLMDVVSAFSKMTDATQKSKIAMELFGMKGTGMLQFLDKGTEGLAALRKEANDIGFVMDENALDAAGNFNDSLDRLKATLLGIRNILGAQLAPVLTEMVESFRAWVMQNRQLIKDNLTKFSKVMLDIFLNTIGAIKYIGTAANSLINKFGGWEKVLKGISTLLLVIASTKILSSLGTMAITVGKTLVTAFTDFGNAALMAKVKAAAIPLAIGAAIVGTVLIIDDFLAWMQGRPSIMGEWFGDYKDASIEKIVGKISGVITNMMGGFGDFIDAKALIKKFKTIEKDLVEYFAELGKGAAIAFIDAFKNIFIPNLKLIYTDMMKALGLIALTDEDKKIANEYNAKKSEVNKKATADYKQQKERRDKEGYGFFATIAEDVMLGMGMIDKASVSPSGSMSPTSTINNGSPQNSQVINANVTVPVNVPAGSDPKNTQKLVKEGVDEALSEMLRKTQTQTSTAIER